MRYVLSVNGDTLRDQNTRFSQLVAAYAEQADDPSDVRTLGGLQVEVPATLAESFEPPEGIDASDIVEIAHVAEADDEEMAVEDHTQPAVEDMTLDQLKDYAQEHDIDLGDAHLKADVLAKIQEA